MAEEDLIEIKFRLADGSDIGPSKYTAATTVATLKERIIAQWPKDKENGPKTVNDVKLINAGKILENNRTLADARLPVGELPGGVMTMHVVLRPPIPDKNSGDPLIYLVNIPGLVIHICSDPEKKTGCSCSIL